MKPLVSFVKNTSIKDLLVMTRCILDLFSQLYSTDFVHITQKKQTIKTIGDPMLCFVTSLFAELLLSDVFSG